ncbi:hypothetical protein Tco_0728057 [Tanacetum coccineum]|uniref:Uncharacterized protein n=1 Tax=Tanacetum coccineum TaxID=301880 RepID=A0ABQ4YL60_9ASTR
MAINQHHQHRTNYHDTLADVDGAVASNACVVVEIMGESGWGFGVMWKNLNTAYPLPSDTAYPVFCPIQLRMTKVIKGEFEKIKDVKVEDVPLTCDASLEVFNDEVSPLSKMDDDLFTYEVEIANIPYDSKMDNDSEQEADDDMGYDPSDIRGDEEVELTDEESSDNDDEIVRVFKIDTNIFDYETPLCSAFNEFNYLLKVDPDLLIKDIMGFKTYEDYKDD